MPTYNRREFVPHAIRYFLRQQYANKELIIVDDGQDNIADLVPNVPCIRYIRLDQKITLGAKLNLACEQAQGSIIANWDDDDWYADWRLSYQVTSLQNLQAAVCGINTLLYYDLRNENAYRYVYPPGERVWLLGSSLCYTRQSWNSSRFADIDVGMDGLFVWSLDPTQVGVLEDHSFSVHFIHNRNVSPKHTDSAWWHAWPVEEIQKIMNDDWLAYASNGIAAHAKVNGHAASNAAIDKKQSFKNVYACLVHEEQDCIVDLVQNLHNNDPASVILLYNGGEHPNLFEPQIMMEKFGAVHHPSPTPVKYGQLHTFALDCMGYALENFSFDTLTIVDSDQLSIRPGYAEYMGGYLRGRSDVGMLSSNPQRVEKHDHNNKVALQAFDEYSLWKPFLDKFDGGEDHFVHWTFWPSTVFTAAASRDLVKIFKEDEQLQHIMRHTKIWATEEVILPTLVRLLGYEIAANPCSYQFMKYKLPVSTPEIEQALHKPDVFWVHPVTRKLNDPLRAYIRDRSKQSVPNYKKTPSANGTAVDTFPVMPLVQKIRGIQGWLSDAEAGLLIDITIKACRQLPAPQNIVEIGSYHGKSTVLFGSVIKRHSRWQK